MATAVLIPTGKSALVVGDDWAAESGANAINPLDDTAMPAPSARFSLPASAGNKLLYGNGASLRTTDYLGIEGTITGVTTQAGHYDYSLSSDLLVLNADYDAPAMVEKNLSEVFEEYVALAGFVSLVMYASTSDPTVTYAGWSGNLWQKLQQLARVHNLSMFWDGQYLIIVDAGLASAPSTMPPASGLQVEHSQALAGRKVLVNWYDTSYVPGATVAHINYCTNPNFDTNISGWAALSGVTLSRNTSTPISGTGSLRGTSTSGGGYGTAIFESPIMPVTSADQVLAWARAESVTLSFSARLGNTVSSGPAYVSPRVLVWDTASSDLLGDMTIDEYEVSPGSVVVLSGTIPVSFYNSPSGESGIGLQLILDFQGPNVQVGTTMDVDRILLTPSSYATYFSGDGDNPTTGATDSWLGTARNSFSQRVIGPGVSLYSALADDNQIFSVDAAAVERYTVDVSGTAISASQPIAVNSRPRAGCSEYQVSASDGLPVNAQQWRDYGGSVTVQPVSNGSQIEIILVGPRTAIPGVPAPYSLSVSDGATDYATLEIGGEAVLTEQDTITLYTPIPATTPAADVGATLDNPFITNLSDAYDLGSWAVMATGETVGKLTATVPSSEVLGLSGSRYLSDSAVYRVQTASNSHSASRLNAEWATTVGQFDTAWSGKTVGDFDTLWNDSSTIDVTVSPLRTS